MARCPSWLLVATLVLLPSAAGAQELPSISLGSRVRVWTPSAEKPVIGRLIDQTDSRLTITVEDSEPAVLIPRDAITRLDVSQGHDVGKAALKGAGIGALVGAAAGAALCALSGDVGTFLAGTALVCAGAGGLVAAPVGAFIGLMDGGPDRWSQVMRPSARNGRILTRPAHSLGFTLRF